MKRNRIVSLSALWLVAVAVAAGCRVAPPSDRDGRLAQIDAVVTAEIQAGHFPGAVVLVGQSDRIVYCKALGDRSIEPDREPMSRETVFDLASLTKPIATATCILILADANRLGLDDRVCDYLPAFAQQGKDGVRIRHLLTHTAGLPPYTNAAALETAYGSPCPEKVIDRICSLQPLSRPGESFRYSCLGYITLARIVTVVTGQSLDEFSRGHIFGPLGMKHTTFNPPASWRRTIAPTEIVNDRPLCGSVHDPLARLMGGVSGNAGLFSTASDLSIFCRMLLAQGTWNGRRILSPLAVSMLTMAQSQGRAYGFDLASDYAWVKGPHASPQAFCHTGYTGTSLVCDPATGRYLIILTNRAHPHDEGTCKEVRRKVAEIAFVPEPNGH